MDEIEIVEMGEVKRIALIAHDNRNKICWTGHLTTLKPLESTKLYATWGTGTLLEEELGLEIHQVQARALGGDQEVGSLIANNGVDILVFLLGSLRAHASRPRR